MPYIDLTGKEISAVIKGELAVVMPIYNEEANIRNVVSEWSTTLGSLGIVPCFVLIDDGSNDRTLATLLEMEKSMTGMIVISKPNSGHGRSCRLGYSLSVASEVSWVLQVDSDGQCDPEYFRDFWSQRGQSDCVFGIRTKRDDGWSRAWTSKICRWSSTLLCGVDLVDPNVPYRLLRREVLARALTVIPAGFDIHNVAITFVLKSMGGLRWTYVPIRFKNRQGGSNSINFANVAQLGFAMLFDLIKLRKSL